MNRNTRISQPPHTAGQQFQGLRSRIEQDQIPSPLEVSRIDHEIWADQTSNTLPGHHVPLSTTDFVAVDQGNSTPRFIRVTTWNFPNNYDMAQSCAIPLAAIIQPFADQRAGEDEVPVVDFSQTGPPRCSHCRGYVNPWCTWSAGGNRWKCSLCHHDTDVQPEYFCNLDANHLRLDYMQRPELNRGTVDFVVGDDYHSPFPPLRIDPPYYVPNHPSSGSLRKPEPLHIMFVIDVTISAIQSGFTKAACDTLLNVLYDEGPHVNGSDPRPFLDGCRIGLMTVDDNIHIYDLNTKPPHAAMIILSELDDVYNPILDRAFVDPKLSRSSVQGCLEAIPTRFADTIKGSSALGAAARTALASLFNTGGSIVVFQSTTLSVGPGALNPTPPEKLASISDPEKAALKSQDHFWLDLGEECAEDGVGMSMFAGTQAANTHLDLGSLGSCILQTGGEIFHHPRFDAQRDQVVLQSQLRRLFNRTTGHSCIMRTRVSRGLRVKGHFGALSEHSLEEVDIGILDADKAFSVLLEHTSPAIDEREYVHIQCAVLYTTTSGQRRVRVINLAVAVAALAGNVFKYGDIEATVCHLAKEAMTKLRTQKISDVREILTEKCANVLLAYRRTCAAATPPSQLILPEAFKLLPLYMLSLQKAKALRSHNVTPDARQSDARRILTLSVQQTMRHIYPRFAALHNLPEGDLPHKLICLRNTYTCMHSHGIYLIDNDDIMILWIGSAVAPQHLEELFGVQAIADIDTKNTLIPREAPLSSKLFHIIHQRWAEYGGRRRKLMVARQNMDAPELEFGDMLVEDKNGGALSYIDYLCAVHKQINVALVRDAPISSGATSFGFRGSSW